MEKIRSKSLKLIPINCLECKEPIKSKGQDIFFYCDECKVGYEIFQNKLRKVDVNFKKYNDTLDGKIRTIPFWTFNSRLKITAREAKKDVKLFLSEFTEFLTGIYVTRGNKGYMKFYVPATSDHPEKLASIGKKFTMEQPVLEDMPPCGFEELAYNSEDAAKLADYIFLTSEIEKTDVVTRLHYTLELKLPKLVIVKFS